MASPLNPMVRIVNKSSAFLILEVACLSSDILASVSLIPEPLSTTWISVLPASFTISLISVASASIAFSINSLTAEDGLCMTSPAAI